MSGVALIEHLWLLLLRLPLKPLARLLAMLVLSLLLLLAMHLWLLLTAYGVLDTAAAKLCSGAGTKLGVCRNAELLDSKPA